MKSGWSPERPTVFIDGERDRITARSGKIKYDIVFESLEKGLVPFLSSYGDLYYGKFSVEFFTTRFKINRRLFLQNLISAPQLTDWDQFALFSSAFYLHMCRVCQTESWIWPSLCFREGDKITQTSGLSRMVATGICKPEPWQHLNVLFLENKGQSPDTVIADYEKITTDEQLHRVLNAEFSNEFFQVPGVSIGITVNSQNCVKLNYVNNGQDHTPVNDTTRGLWANLVAWHQKYGRQPKLKIYTDWPDLIQDSENFWDIELAGPSKPIHEKIFFPGHIERAIRELHESNPAPHEHVVHIVKPVKLDVTELLCWLDLEHTTFIDSNHKFIVYRPDAQYKNTYIDLSSIH